MFWHVHVRFTQQTTRDACSIRRRRLRSQNVRSEQLCVWVAPEGWWALEQQSGDMKAQSVVARNGSASGNGMRRQSPCQDKERRRARVVDRRTGILR